MTVPSCSTCTGTLIRLGILAVFRVARAAEAARASTRRVPSSIAAFAKRLQLPGEVDYTDCISAGAPFPVVAAFDRPGPPFHLGCQGQRHIYLGEPAAGGCLGV